MKNKNEKEYPYLEDLTEIQIEELKKKVNDGEVLYIDPGKKNEKEKVVKSTTSRKGHLQLLTNTLV